MYTSVKLFFSAFKNPKKGTVVAMSLAMVSAFLLMSAGAMTVVRESRVVGSQVEKGNNSYFAAERGMEYALYDISGHQMGYEVDENSACGTNCYNVSKAKKTGSETTIDIKSLSNAPIGNIITIPNQETSTPSDNINWNSISSGSEAKIPLFRDKSQK
ncbi:MAG: hypothetical protein WCJ84_01780 [Candidatus Peregrinibacteria bacterium]